MRFQTLKVCLLCAGSTIGCRSLFASAQIEPIIVLASEYNQKRESPEVLVGKKNFESVNRYVQGFFAAQIGASYEIAPTLLVPSTLTSKQWLDLSELSKVAAHRYDFYNAAKLAAAGYASDKTMRYVISIYVGVQPDAWLGAADAGTAIVVPPRATSIECPNFDAAKSFVVDKRCADSVYAIAHELGHSFGLNHSCSIRGFSHEATCNHSVMQAERGPKAQFLKEEKIQLLKAKDFFAPLNKNVKNNRSFPSPPVEMETMI